LVSQKTLWRRQDGAAKKKTFQAVAVLKTIDFVVWNWRTMNHNLPKLWLSHPANEIVFRQAD
jgi:hypothetical protein